MTDSADPGRTLEQQAFDAWPDGLRALFDGTALATKVGFTASLLMADANGRVRTSLLGIGELYAPDARTVCVALWPRTRTAGALAQGRRATLTFVFDDVFYQVHVAFESLRAADAEAHEASGGLVCFHGSIETGEAQRVRYARLTSGITYELGEGKDAILERWEQQIAYLKKVAGSVAGH
jgi:hypothetical protein